MAHQERNEKRNDAMNILKFAALVFVVLIHCKLPGAAGQASVGVAAMAVPVFFMISGYYSYGVSSSRLWKRAKRIFRLTLIANFIYFVWDICVELLSGRSLGVWLKENCSIKRLLVWVLTNESSLRGHLWFLGALLYAYFFLLILLKCAEKGCLHGFLQKYMMKCLIALSGLLLMGNLILGEAAAQFLHPVPISYIPYIRNWLFMGVPFFCMAYWIHAYEKRIQEVLDRKKLWGVLGISIVLNVLEVIYMQPSGLYITTIAVNIATFLLVLQYQGSVKSRLLIWMGNLADRYGLWIYILQVIVIKNIQWFCSEYGIADVILIQWMSPAVSLVITSLLSVILVRICSNNKG